MRLHFKWIIPLLTILLFQCVGIRKTTKKDGPLTIFFSAKSQMTIINEGRVANFGADIHFTLTDSFHIKVGGPFGITAGEVFIMGPRYLFINRLDRTMLHGEITDDRLQALFQIPLSGDILSRLIIIPWRLAHKEMLKNIFSGYDVLDKKMDNNGNLSELRLKKNDETIIFRYEKYKKAGRIRVPQKIYIEIPEREQKMQMSLRDIKENHDVFPVPPVIGEEYRQITLN